LHHYCSNLFSYVLGGIAVPLFFFISGFLFFLNIENFNLQSYGNKLQTRGKTLLIPYLFWNLFAIAIYSLITAIPASKAFVNHDMEFSGQALFPIFQ
jgi:fucose 4-O-acetylase-like acetyltransferase